METTQLRVTGMVCDACAGHVKRALESVAGVQAVQVDRGAGRATAQHRDADDSALVAAVVDAGYEATVEHER